jgi:hypothetical protein
MELLIFLIKKITYKEGEHPKILSPTFIRNDNIFMKMYVEE